jgi:hypothetical protein
MRFAIALVWLCSAPAGGVMHTYHEGRVSQPSVQRHRFEGVARWNVHIRSGNL